TPPRAVNLRRGRPLWYHLTAAGVPATVLRCPCTYPPDVTRGRTLGGLGVPDLRGGLGTATFYTPKDGINPREGAPIVRPRVEGPGPISTYLIGPRNPRDRSDVRLEITLHPDPSTRSMILRSAGTPSELTLREGEWSGWLKVKFKVGLLQSARGMVRFYLS